MNDESGEEFSNTPLESIYSSSSVSLVLEAVDDAQSHRFLLAVISRLPEALLQWNEMTKLRQAPVGSHVREFN
jgi:hypothetical protein